ncbi:leucyl aminopeptidase [Mycena olivaceomarginata]|nr:leucyl aminopeptidase [Mycena olivaceomarginata]
MSPDPHDRYRIPTNIRPSHYDVTFWTDLESLEFGGHVAVDLDILWESAEHLVNDKNFSSVQCAALEGDQLQSAQIVADKELGRATLNFIVKIAYSATLRGSMNGYYKSAWQRNGKTEYYALTQFQPTDARAAVPCWDEPQLKATWTITMISRAETVNISNMAAESEVAYDPTSAPKSDAGLATLLSTLLKKDVQWKLTKFQETLPISSYLVAFANGPFAHLETKVVMPLSGRTVPLRVYATPDIVHQGEFCLEVTAKVLPLYETIFDIEYPLPKLDVLAANDFDMGAMEVVNWGLITGRAAVFLMDPKKADIASRKAIAGTQSHEVAHILFPEWESTSAFVATHVTRAMTLDAKRSSHPIEVECPDANFINQCFACSQYIGEERFLEGVTLYLKKHLYGTPLLAIFGTAYQLLLVGEDIVRLMNNWITKTGFPLITITETSTGIHVRQDRYLDNGTPTADENETIWNVPLVILTVDGNGRVHVDKTAILEQREKTIALDTSRTFKLNAGTTNRVSYTPERLEKIATETAKEDSVFSLSDRIGLLYDVSELSKASLTQVSSLLTLFDIWRNETNYLIWASMLSSFGEIAAAFEGNTEISAGLRAFIRTLFGPLVQRLGYEFPEGESVDIVQLRKTAILGAVVGRDESATQELRSHFTDYIKTGDKTRIPSDLKKSIFTTAARYGGREEFDAPLKIIEDPVNAADRSAATIPPRRPGQT